MSKGFPLSDERCEEIISAAHKTVAVLKRERGMTRQQAWQHVLEQVELWQPFSPAAKRLLQEYTKLILGGNANG